MNIQIDETKLNYNVQSHRGRSPRKAIWAITIVCTDKIPCKGYIEIVNDRRANTHMPIIQRVVRSGSIIYTDELKSYMGLSNINGYIHQNVCHRYHIIDLETSVHTQHVESFNNKIKLEIM
ncbi:hypothetical protein DMUE_1280 [Dictyocoela muelleri]|nr:hypothetical protein DMUE_1280 [Dictyocoela muelleri]